MLKKSNTIIDVQRFHRELVQKVLWGESGDKNPHGEDVRLRYIPDQRISPKSKKIYIYFTSVNPSNNDSAYIKGKLLHTHFSFHFIFCLLRYVLLYFLNAHTHVQSLSSLHRRYARELLLSLVHNFYIDAYKVDFLCFQVCDV